MRFEPDRVIKVYYSGATSPQPPAFLSHFYPGGPPRPPYNVSGTGIYAFCSFKQHLYVLNILEEYIKKCLLIVTTLEIGIGFSEKVSFCC